MTAHSGHQAARLATVIESKKTRDGVDLATLSLLSPVLAVFLRHPGCTFCRETLSDIARLRHGLESAGIRIVLIHHGVHSAMQSLLAKHGLGDLDLVYDSDLTLYRAFGLKRGRLSQVFGPKAWVRLFAGLRKHGLGLPGGDPFQMPGVFLLHRCEVVGSFRHRSIADRPDYGKIAGDFTVD